MGKKKFFDKKKSATFNLMARDTSDPYYSPDPSGDRVFVRVDNNEYAPTSCLNEENSNDGDLVTQHESIFSDAPESYVDYNSEVPIDYKKNGTSLPDHIRKEILELGFPDDGYNYLIHLREIRNSGAGSGYYPNPKAQFELLPRDVKAYDASRIEVPCLSSDVIEENSIYNVASKTVSVRLNKALDLEVAAMLDDNDSSNCGSDIEDLEEDFIIKANHFDRPISEEISQQDATDARVVNLLTANSETLALKENDPSFAVFDSEVHRIRRPLDEQFDLLELNEYGSEDEYEDDFNVCIGDEFEAHESLEGKINNAFKDLPSGHMRLNPIIDFQEPPSLTPEEIRRFREYAEKYENENHDEDKPPYEETSDESEDWDCETIVSTYSTLENHPGKIGAPEPKKKRPEALQGTSNPSFQKIILKGKDSIPVDFLPRREERIKDDTYKKTIVKMKPRSLESKEEKRERKSAVKSERRDARRTKKETKDIYKCESQHAQKLAAYSGPSSIHMK